MSDEPTEWRKSRTCDGGACVEVADGILVHDSTDPDGPRLAFTADSWVRFTAEVKTGA